MGKKIGSSALKRKSPRFTGPSPEEAEEIRRQIQEEKEEEAKRLEKLEKEALKVGMPETQGEPEHSPKPVSLAGIDEIIEKEQREREQQKKRKKRNLP